MKVKVLKIYAERILLSPDDVENRHSIIHELVVDTADEENLTIQVDEDTYRRIKTHGYLNMSEKE